MCVSTSFFRYKSKFSVSVRQEIEERKCSHRTMGFAHIPLDSPQRFLKSGAGIRLKHPKNHVCYRREQPPIPEPNKVQRPCQSASTNKNFKLVNIRSVQTAKVRKPSAHFVDTKNGDCQALIRSGMVPFYVNQPKFGEIPAYLKRRKNELEMKIERAREDEIRQQPKCQFITQRDRNDLLRVNYDDI